MSFANRVRGSLLIACALAFVPMVGIDSCLAAEVEFLTPRPGAKIMARNPETHLVLGVKGQSGPIKVKVAHSGEVISPTVDMEGDGRSFLHFRLPMIPGKNSYTLIPGGQRLEIKFQRIQADLTLKTLAKDTYLFHQASALPASCGDCHDLQEVQIIKPVGLEKQISCAVCHQNLIDKGSVKHGPTVNQECLGCHRQSAEPFKIGFPAVGTQELCLICHTSKKQWLSRKEMHGPMLLGGCTLCHNPHGENHKYQLWAEGSLDLCIACHSNKANLVSEKDRVPYVHGVIFGNGCVACHNPHATDEQFMLNKPINTLCLSCHQTVLAKSPGHPVARHPVAGPKDPLRPGRALVCTSCHEPHGSSHQYFLIETKLGGRLCRGCHKR
jgi:predicted CXXCH cytochrome family protein